MPRSRATPAELTMLAGAIVTVVASFLDADSGIGTWGRGLSTLKLVPLYAIAVGGVVAVRRFAGAEMPERVGTFSWPQILLAISFFGAVMAIAWIFAASDAQAGLYGMAAGSLVTLVGAVVDQRASARRLHLLGARARSGGQAGRGDLVVLAGAAAMLVASFLTFWKLPVTITGVSSTFNAWSRDLLFPVSAIPVVCALVMAVYVVLRSFLRLPLPERMVGFTGDQVLIACAVQAALMMFVFLIEDNGAFDFGIGFYLMLVAAGVLLVGAVVRTREPRTSY